jgi:hypothetical protein
VTCLLVRMLLPLLLLLLLINHNCPERILSLTYIAPEQTWTYSEHISCDHYPPANLLARRSNLQKTQLPLLLHVELYLQSCCLATRWPNPLQYFDISFFIHLMTQYKGLCLLVRKYTVVYRPVAKQWLCKQWLFLGNASVKLFPRQRIHTQQQSWK